MCASLLLLVVLAAADQASASHFRSGNLSWHKTGAPGTEVAFQNVQAWRRDSGFGCVPQCGGTDGNPVAGDIVDLSGEGDIHFGDETSGSPRYRVTFANVAENYIIVRALAENSSSDFNFLHPYGGNGPFTALTESCCTIGELQNAPGSSWNVKSYLDLGTDSQSPRSSLPPIVSLPSGGVQHFTVPATDAGGQTLRFRLSDGAESCVDECTDPQPPGLTIDPGTGVVTWDTTGREGLWWTGVVIEAVSGSTVVSSSQIQYIIRVGGGDGNNPPAWEAPTPADGTTFEVSPGQTLAFDVQARDPDTGSADQTEILQSTGPGALSATPGNPATGRYSYTPSEAELGSETFVQFLAQDNGSPPQAAPFLSYKVRVVAPSAQPDPEPIPRPDPPRAQQPSSLALAGAATELVGGSHRVEAAATGEAARPLAGTQIRWSVGGAHPATGAATTGADGKASIEWNGTASGRDTLTAFVDSDGNGLRGAEEGEATHVVEWLAPPTVGKTANVEPVSGTVRIKLPPGASLARYRLGPAQAKGFVPLTQAAQIPLGSTLDTTRGRVEVQSAVGVTKPGQTQSGQFYAGHFQVRQTGPSTRPVTEMVLNESLKCQSNKRRGKVTAAAGRSRRLWGSGKGRFRTRGRHSSATVRGTEWLTKDSCNTTTTTVKSGVVTVRDFGKRKDVTLRKGKSYTARARRR